MSRDPSFHDGEVWTIGGSEWVFNAERDDEGRGYTWWKCGTCDETAHTEDDLDRHVCPPLCPECGERSADVRTEFVDGIQHWSCCGLPTRCPQCKSRGTVRSGCRSCGTYCRNCTWVEARAS